VYDVAVIQVDFHRFLAPDELQHTGFFSACGQEQEIGQTDLRKVSLHGSNPSGAELIDRRASASAISSGPFSQIS
jgi:hypothetical protein